MVLIDQANFVCNLEPTWVFHVGSPKGKYTLSLFTIDKLKACEKALEIILPSLPERTHGYHISCYKRFIDLPKGHGKRNQNNKK